MSSRESSAATGVQGSKWTLALAASSFLLVGSAPEAQAFPLPSTMLSCSVCNTGGWPTTSGIQSGLAMIASVPLAGGVVTGIGSSIVVAKGTVSRGMFITAYVFSGLNFTSSAFWGVLATNSSEPDLPIAFTIMHAAVGVFDLVMPTLGFALGPGPRVAPVPVGGRDAGGLLWGGAGLQLYRF